MRRRPSPASSPTSSETIVAPSIARSRSRITRSAAASTAVVSSPPTPSPTTGSRSMRVGRSPRTPRTPPAAPRQGASQSSDTEDAVRRKDHQTRILEADEHGEHVGALRTALLLVVGNRRLVAVVAVRDQNLPLGEGLGDCRVGRQPPQTRAVGFEIRLALRPLRRRPALVEEEERLELGAGLAQEAAPSFFRAPIGARVREDPAL